MFDRAVRILTSAFLLFAILFASAALATSAQAQEDGAGHEGPQHRREGPLQKRLETVPPDRRQKIPPRLKRGLEEGHLGKSLVGASAAKRQQSAASLVMRAAAGLTGVIGGSTSIADVNGDGNQDLLITGEDANNDRTATLYLGDGQGGFSEAGAGLAGVLRSSTSIADVNGDGNQDLLITGDAGTFEDPDLTATLYLGGGEGDFSEANAGLAGVDNGSASIADVDGDGNQDLLITGREANGDRTATLYVGDGQGGFSEANAGLAGVNRSSTSIADVDGDSNPDLLITGLDVNADQTATLYLGDGQGGFTEVDAGLTGVSESSTSIADVDGDGNQDLLVTGNAFGNDVPTPLATLYLGDGEGGFSEANAGLTGTRLGSTSIADIDGDGNQDLLITGENTNGNPSSTLYLGDGQGGFSEAGAGLTGVDYGSTSIADIGEDGDKDLLITGSGALFRRPSARIYINRRNQPLPNRAPTFARGFSYDRLLAPGVTLRRIVEAGDLDGDLLSIGAPGNPNVSVIDAGNGVAQIAFTPSRDQGGDVANISVEASDPDGATGSFSTSVEVSPVVAAFSAGLTGVRSSATSITDVDRDGNEDLLITGSGVNFDERATATLYLGDGQGGFTEAGAGLAGVEGGSTSIADVDGDGNEDLLITGRDANFDETATLYLGDGQGGFTEAGAGLAGVVVSSTSIADVDGDGNQDLLITGQDPNGDPTATLYLGDGQGGFSEAGAGLTGVSFSSTSIADVDGNGNEDLLITGEDINGDPTSTLYLGDGQGGFSEADIGLTGVSFSSTSIADVNGDENQDLLITGDAAGSFSELDPTTTLYLGDGQGGFSEANAGLTGVRASSTSIADVDSDGNQDLLITGSFTATLYLGDGQGGFSEANAGLTGAWGSSTSIADIDGDQDPDVLITGLSGASLAPSSILHENLFDNPLPVEMAGFEATTDGEEVRLTWQTASETNNAGFEVQRRVGERGNEGEGAWGQVGFVDSKAEGGTTNEPQSYRFEDEDLPFAADRLEYRLRQVDTDGTATLTDPVTVERTVEELALKKTFPNPARNQVTVRFAVPEARDVSLELYDLLGRQVRTVEQGETQGRRELQVDLSGLSSGTYFLRLRAEGRAETQRLTVVR